MVALGFYWTFDQLALSYLCSLDGKITLNTNSSGRKIFDR